MEMLQDNQMQEKHSMDDYMGNMDNKKFKSFLNEACAKLKVKYGKVGMLLDNTSYEKVMHDYVLKSK